MTHIARVRLGLFAAFLVTAALSAPLSSSTEAAVSPRTSTAISAPQIVLAAVTTRKATPRSHVAMRWAKTQAGKWYHYGSAGPGTYDCSGLVMRAYQHAGKSLPHFTGAMLSSGKLVRVSKSQVRWGDLVFFGSGHVELWGHWTNKAKTTGVTFGAHHSGTRIGYRSFNSAYYGPTGFYRVK